MKYKFTILIIACVTISLFSCKKESVENNYVLNGKWQETELHMYDVDSGKIAYDTTYYHPFTDLDYMQFTSDTAATSSDHYYYINEPGYPKTPQLITQLIDKLGYKAIGGGKFVLNTTAMNRNFAGIIVNDTIIEINANKIQLHAVFYSHTPAYAEIDDSYYQR